MLRTFFRLVGKAFRMTVNRPLQRFNIANRARKHLGVDAKYFKPAPRAISPGFKSISSSSSIIKSFSETINDDRLVIEASNSLPVIKTVIKNELSSPDLVKQEKPARPLPKSSSLQLSDPAVIWHVDKVPPGRLDLNKLQELMINKLADDDYWTPHKIAEVYNIKEEYAENITKYFKQIRIIISPGLAKNLDYVARNDPVYQATKHIVYHVDKSLRSEHDKQFDATFLPTDNPDPEIKELLEASALQRRQQPDLRLTQLVKRPKPLKIGSVNEPKQLNSKDSD